MTKTETILENNVLPDGARADPRVLPVDVANTDHPLGTEPPPALSAREALDASAHWSDLVDSLEREIDPVFKYPLRVTCGKGTSRLTLPTSVDAYKDTVYRVGQEPEDVAEGYTVYKQVAFWYEVKENYRHVGKVDYLVTDSAGRVVEVGARSQDTLDVFKENIFGRDVTDHDLLRLYDLNERLINALRDNAACAQKLESFRANREHRKEWSDSARLAYYDPENFDVIRWAKGQGFSERELYKAGFVERTVTETSVRYSNREKPVVFIPFKDDDGRVVLWRMRVIKPKNPTDPKYLSAPLERADRYPPSVHRELYQSELLKDIRGKPLIITEGEFKCLVTTQLTGIATVGITGITQVTDLIIQKIVQARPSSITVILDRDPKGKGFARTDELTDSERAAFMIAERLQRAGHTNVRVGTIPDHFQGDKCGIDDLLLDIDRKQGADAATQALRQIVDDSKLPREWLAQRSNDPELQELLARIQRLRQVHRDFGSHIVRSDNYSGDSEARTGADGRLGEVKEMLDMLLAAYSRHLDEHYNGARRIHQPPRKFLTLYPIRSVRDQYRKCLVTADGAVMQLGHFKEPILSLRATPPDLPTTERLADAEGIAFPISMAKLTKAFYHPRRAPPGEDPRKGPSIAELYERGREILAPAEEQKLWNSKKISYEVFIQRVFAGWLAKIYPPSEYRYEEKVSLRKVHRTHWEDIVRVPITIFKDGQKPVAFCFLPYWNAKDAHEVQIAPHNDGVEPHEARQMAVAKLARDAAFAESRSRAAIRSFLRNPKLDLQVEKLNQISGVLTKVCSDEGRSRAAEFLQTLGVGNDVTEHSGAVYLSKDNRERFVSTLGQEDLINQGIQSGLLWIPPGESFAEARFGGDVVIIPERNESGVCIGLSILPVDFTDRKLKRLPPVPKTIYTVDSIRSTTRTFDRTRTFFPAIDCEPLKGKTVLIAPSELECLQLRSVVNAANLKDTVVLGIREFDSISHAEYQRLAAAGPARIVFLSQASEAHQMAIRYAPLALSDAKTHATMCIDAVKGSNTPPKISAITFNQDLASVLIEVHKDIEVAKGFISELLKQGVFSPDEPTRAKLAFSELLADVESAVAMRGKTQSGGEQELPFSLDEAVEMLRVLWSVADDNSRPLEEFLSDRYFISQEKAIEALKHGFDKPVYRPGSEVMTKIPRQMWADYVGVETAVRLLQERVRLPVEPDLTVLALLTREARVSDNDFNDLNPQDIQSTLERLSAQNICTLKSKEHTLATVLGRQCHYVTLNVEHHDGVLTARGVGLSKKTAEADAFLRLHAGIQEHTELRAAFNQEEHAFRGRRDFERRFRERKCFATLSREVRALKLQLIDVEIVKGKQSRTTDGKEWLVPLTLNMDGVSHSFTCEGSTPDASQNMAAAQLIVRLRDLLQVKRDQGEYSDPPKVVSELEYLAGLVGANIVKHSSTLEVIDEVQNEASGRAGFWGKLRRRVMRLLANQQGDSASQEAPKKKEQKVHTCQWSLQINGEEITKSGSAPKKTQAERIVATQLLRELEKRDPVNMLVLKLAHDSVR